MGSMTGRGAGFCARVAAPGYANAVGGHGFGAWGCGGRGRGRRNRFFATGLPGWVRGGYGTGIAPSAIPADSEIDALKQEAEFLQSSLTQINKRIEEMQSK